MDDLFMYIVVAAVSLAILFLLGYYFVQWAFDVKRQLWNQKQTILILIRAARRLGESDEELERIEREINMQEYK